MIDAAIETSELSKTFGSKIEAVKGLDFVVERGGVYGLIGKNGAGKTTALRLIMGLLRPSHGAARVLGENLWKASRATRAKVAYVSQVQQIHDWMTLEELSYYLSHFYEKWDMGYARDLSNRFVVAWDRPVGNLSGGQQRKASVTLALAARPEVLILDEPAAGLDPVARRELVDELIEALSTSDGCTVLLSTHIISDLERIADHVGIMDHGRLVSSSRLEDLQSRTKRVQVIFEGNAAPDGFSIPGSLRTSTEGPVVTSIVRIEDDHDLDRIRPTEGARMNVFPLGLEDIFIEILGPSAEVELAEEAE